MIDRKKWTLLDSNEDVRKEIECFNAAFNNIFFEDELIHHQLRLENKKKFIEAYMKYTKDIKFAYAQ